MQSLISLVFGQKQPTLVSVDAVQAKNNTLLACIYFLLSFDCVCVQIVLHSTEPSVSDYRNEQFSQVCALICDYINHW